MDKFFTVFMIMFAVILISAPFFSEPKLERIDKCIELVNKAIPDPNDTDARLNFLKDCYE